MKEVRLTREICDLVTMSGTRKIVWVLGIGGHWDTQLLRGRGGMPSIIMRRGRRVRGRERHTLTRFLGFRFLHGLHFLGLLGKGRQCAKQGVPLFLAKVVSNVVHIFYGP